MSELLPSGAGLILRMIREKLGLQDGENVLLAIDTLLQRLEDADNRIIEASERDE